MQRMGLALLLAIFGFRPLSELKLGDPAPALKVEQLLQAPNGTRATWGDLHGRAVVLEFWATWCGGCVEQIPHLNALAEKFKNQPIQFISVTDEEKGVVSRFLEKHPMAGWIALDSGENTFRDYGVEGRPQTFLVDANGIIRAITNPTQVTDSVVEDFLAGKPLSFRQPESMGSPFIGSEPSAPTPVFQVVIRPAAPVAVTGMSPGAERETNGRFEAWGFTLRRLLSEAYDIPDEQRIEGPDWARETRYDLSVLPPRAGDAERWPLVREALTAAFHLKLHRETRETDVYVLKKVPGNEPKLKPATTRGHSGPWSRQKGELQAIGMTPGYVARIAETVLGCPAFDETEMKDRYDFDLKWDSNHPESIVTAVRDQLGLELAKVRRPLEYLIIDSAIEPQTR